MDIYTDYANWKFENHELISELVKRKSITIARFTPVLVVIDYLYDKVCNKQKLNNDEEIFFSMGFDFVYDCFLTISNIYEFTFKKDINKLESCAKTINLLLYVNEFQAEALSFVEDTDDLKELDAFEERLIDFIEKEDNIPEEQLVLLNKAIDDLFDGKEFYTMDQIYYEIAVNYGIYQDDEDDSALLKFMMEKKNN
ncbi:MAG: hypothetical protein J6R47_01420 [Acholeplasmatales bacterium]|nr:hypothetical protein [Acholeplasmatales bacterium]